jgi:hypothetical protein
MAVSRKQIVMAGIIPAIDVLLAVEFFKDGHARHIQCGGRAMTSN